MIAKKYSIACVLERVCITDDDDYVKCWSLFFCFFFCEISMHSSHYPGYIIHSCLAMSQHVRMAMAF